MEKTSRYEAIYARQSVDKKIVFQSKHRLMIAKPYVLKILEFIKIRVIVEKIQNVLIYNVYLKTLKQEFV